MMQPWVTRFCFPSFLSVFFSLFFILVFFIVSFPLPAFLTFFFHLLLSSSSPFSLFFPYSFLYSIFFFFCSDVQSSGHTDRRIIQAFKRIKDTTLLKKMQPQWTESFNHFPNLHNEVTEVDSPLEFL